MRKLVLFHLDHYLCVVVVLVGFYLLMAFCDQAWWCLGTIYGAGHWTGVSCMQGKSLTHCTIKSLSLFPNKLLDVSYFSYVRQVIETLMQRNKKSYLCSQDREGTFLSFLGLWALVCRGLAGFCPMDPLLCLSWHMPLSFQRDPYLGWNQVLALSVNSVRSHFRETLIFRKVL